MRMIVGLGNPGPKYLVTRHNIGFMVIDALANEWKLSGQFRDDKKALVAKDKFNNTDVLLVKPQTFMNLSGESVQPLMHFYKLELSDLLVIHDEVDLPFGQIRFQSHRGHGGQNGVRNIHEHLGGNGYGRLRIGVGRPSHPDFKVGDYVLQSFNTQEQKVLPEFLGLCCEAVETFIEMGLERAATEYNSSKGRIDL